MTFSVEAISGDQVYGAHRPPLGATAGRAVAPHHAEKCPSSAVRKNACDTGTPPAPGVVYASSADSDEARDAPPSPPSPRGA